MASTKYNYSITEDTGEAQVDSSSLIIEIQTSAIVTALDYIGTAGDDLDIWFKEDLSSEDWDTLSGLVTDHEGISAEVTQEFTSEGHSIVSTSYGHYEEDAGFKGFRLVASGVDVDTIHDHQITSQIYMSGGHFWNRGGQCGDYAEASIVDKDDTLGLFGLYGLVSGVDVLELFKFAETIYLNPDGIDATYLRTPDDALVYPGLYLRTKIHTVGDLPTCLGITYFWFEE